MRMMCIVQPGLLEITKVTDVESMLWRSLWDRDKVVKAANQTVEEGEVQRVVMF